MNGFTEMHILQLAKVAYFFFTGKLEIAIYNPYKFLPG
jgi:hypothetical protein